MIQSTDTPEAWHEVFQTVSQTATRSFLPTNGDGHIGPSANLEDHIEHIFEDGETWNIGRVLASNNRSPPGKWIQCYEITPSWLPHPKKLHIYILPPESAPTDWAPTGEGVKDALCEGIRQFELHGTSERHTDQAKPMVRTVRMNS